MNKTFRVITIAYVDRNVRVIYEGNSERTAREVFKDAKNAPFISEGKIVKLQVLEPTTLETHG